MSTSERLPLFLAAFRLDFITGVAFLGDTAGAFLWRVELSFLAKSFSGSSSKLSSSSDSVYETLNDTHYTEQQLPADAASRQRENYLSSLYHQIFLEALREASLRFWTSLWQSLQKAHCPSSHLFSNLRVTYRKMFWFQAEITQRSWNTVVDMEYLNYLLSSHLYQEIWLTCWLFSLVSQLLQTFFSALSKVRHLRKHLKLQRGKKITIQRFLGFYITCSIIECVCNLQPHPPLLSCFDLTSELRLTLCDCFSSACGRTRSSERGMKSSELALSFPDQSETQWDKYWWVHLKLGLVKRSKAFNNRLPLNHQHTYFTLFQTNSQQLPNPTN